MVFEFVSGAEADHVRAQVDKCQVDAQFSQFVRDLRLRRRRSGAVIASQCVATLRRMIAVVKVSSTLQLLSFVMAIGRILIAANRSQLLVFTMVRRVLGIIRRQHIHLMYKKRRRLMASNSKRTAEHDFYNVLGTGNAPSNNSTASDDIEQTSISAQHTNMSYTGSTGSTAVPDGTVLHTTIKLGSLISTGEYVLDVTCSTPDAFNPTPAFVTPFSMTSPCSPTTSSAAAACVKDASEVIVSKSRFGSNDFHLQGSYKSSANTYTGLGEDYESDVSTKLSRSSRGHGVDVDWGYTDNTFFDDLKHLVFESLEDLISDIRSDWQPPWHLIRDLFSDIIRILVYGESNSVQRTLRSIRQQHAKRKSALELIFAGSGENIQSAEIALSLANEGFQVFYVELAAVRVLAAKCDVALVGAVSILCNGDAVAASGTLTIAEAMKSFGKPLLMVAATFRICPLSLFGRFSMNEACPFRIHPSVDRLGSFGCPSRAERASIPVPVYSAGSTEGLITGVVQFDWIEAMFISSYISNTGCLDPSAVMLYVNKWCSAEDSSLGDEYSFDDINRTVSSSNLY
eukprot:Lankesteria_metandrocarpae@DN1274_c0_g1_i1.p1